MISKRFTHICLATLLLVFSQVFREATAKELGEECASSLECENGSSGDLSVCGPDYTCICNANSVPDHQNTTCLEKVNVVEGPCIITAQCTQGSLGNQSYCDLLTGNVCRCNLLTSIPNSARNKCLPIRSTIGVPCEETLQCQLSNSVCSTSKLCDCHVNFVPSSPLDSCLLIINELGRGCVESQQCSSGIPGSLSACIENECRCIENATSGQNEHVCRATAMYVGDSCEITAQCTVNLEHSYCQGNKCVCLPGAVTSGDGMKCLLKAYLGEDCEEDNQCSHVEHSKCLVNEVDDKITCQCDSGYIADPSGRKCEPEYETVKVGQPCTDGSLCPGIPGISSGCSASGYCSCFGGFVQSRNLDDCLPIRDSLGDSCVQKQQCQLGEPGIHSTCANNVCNCTSNAISVIGGNTCYRKAIMVRDQCIHQEQCIANLGPSICIEGICQCFEGYKQSADNTKCI